MAARIAPSTEEIAEAVSRLDKIDRALLSRPQVIRSLMAEYRTTGARANDWLDRAVLDDDKHRIVQTYVRTDGFVFSALVRNTGKYPGITAPLLRTTLAEVLLGDEKAYLPFIMVDPLTGEQTRVRQRASGDLDSPFISTRDTLLAMHDQQKRWEAERQAGNSAEDIVEAAAFDLMHPGALQYARGLLDAAEIQPRDGWNAAATASVVRESSALTIRLRGEDIDRLTALLSRLGITPS